MKTTLVVCMSIVTLALLASAWAAPAAENPTEKLGVLVGRWEVEATVNGQKGKTHTVRECRWAPQGHDYLVCSLIGSTPLGDHRQLTIFYYNTKESNYIVVTIVDPVAKPQAPVTVNIQGNVWTTVMETKMAGKPAQIRSTTERITVDRATLKIESSDDGGAHWSPMASGTEKRVGD